MTTGAVAAKLGAELVGRDDLPLTRMDTLDRADAQTLSFIRDKKHAALWAESAAGAAIITRDVEAAGHDPQTRALLIVDDADHALIDLLQVVTPPTRMPEGVHPSAIVDASATIGDNVRIGAGAVIGPECFIGDDTVIHSSVTLGGQVRIGADCELRSGVTIEDRCVLGDRVRIHANTAIGADGFGYHPDLSSGLPVHRKVPHAGAVRIEDDVEIGACTSIDRGRFGDTLIGAGTKIDNQVQIGHNCVVGRACLICGVTGIGGSVTIGDGCVIAGGVGVADGHTIGAGATLAARAGVMNDVPAGESWFGYPADEAKRAFRSEAALRRLPKTIQEMREAMRRIARLEDAQG